MFKKGKKNSSHEGDFDYLENIDLVEAERNSKIEELFGNTTVESTAGNRIVIRDNEPKRKVRRRVKKGTKEEVLKKRQQESTKKRVAIVSSDSKAKTSPGDNGSMFRAKSSDWQDRDYSEYKKAVKQPTEKKSFFEEFLAVSPIQWVACALAFVIFVSAVMTTSVYARLKGAENRAYAMECLMQFEAAGADTIAQQVESIEAPISAEEATPDIYKVLSLVLSSVEKDLKIKLVDEDDTLVKDIPWSVNIVDGDNNETEAADDDMDGIIHLTDVKAGDYTVTLVPSSSLEGYELPQEAQTVDVRAKVEYKVIQDIKEEIKSEKEINVAAEDANGNQAADVETGPVNTDTVELVDSTKSATGEEYIEATPDLTKTASIDKENKFLATIENLKKTVKSPVAGNKIFATRLMYRADNEPCAEHSFLDGKCTVCGEVDPNYKAPCIHEYKDGKCTKCDEADPNYKAPCNHEYKNGKCTKCGEADPNYKAPCPHEKKTYSSNGNGTHKVTCSTCNTVLNAAENCDSKTNCSKCGYAHSHTYTCTSNGDGTHKAKCSCGDEKTENCSYSGKKCSLCGYEKKAEYSDDAQLYDALKNALYVKDGDSYRLAKYKDYRSGNYSTYYRKAETFEYTGWQTIDGKRYYFKSDHTKVTGEQVIGGVSYKFDSEGVLSQGSGTLGIDVSKYQPSINWASVKASGVSYVIIRCGYRGSSTGVLVEDPYFKSHIRGAKAAGLKVGVYFFTTAVSEAEAVEEASMCAYLCKGYGLDYPIFMDCESSNRPGYNGMSAGQRTEIIKAFCNTIRSAGYSAGVYANKTWLSSYMNAGALSGYKIWLAQYNSGGPTYSGRYDMWQYTSKGSVNGISGYVDMNQSYMGY